MATPEQTMIQVLKAIEGASNLTQESNAALAEDVRALQESNMQAIQESNAKLAEDMQAIQESNAALIELILQTGVTQGFIKDGTDVDFGIPDSLKPPASDSPPVKKTRKKAGSG